VFASVEGVALAIGGDCEAEAGRVRGARLAGRGKGVSRVMARN
jgi:hypothetical protein